MGSHLSVTQNPGNTVFNVTGASPSAIRTLTTNWQDFTYPGGADYRAGGYRYLKHNHPPSGLSYAAEDVWWWSTYSWLQLDITAPAAGTLTLTVQYINLSVSDPHDGSNPTITPSYPPAPADLQTVTYNIPLVSGSNPSVQVDLLFPNEGGPLCLGRIYTIMLSGFQSGTYTLNSMALVRQSSPYFKAGFGVPASGGDYSALVMAVDGSFVFGNLPDQANKPDEIGPFGGSIRYIDPNSSGDTQKNLEDFWLELNEIEGISASYNLSAFQAANQDSFGYSLGPELAQWLWETLPYATGTSLSPDCSPVCSQITITTGLQYLICVCGSIGGGLEAMVTLNGERAPEGILVSAIDTTTGDVVASAVTDSQGYVVVTPVPANGIRTYGLSGG